MLDIDEFSEFSYDECFDMSSNSLQEFDFFEVAIYSLLSCTIDMMKDNQINLDATSFNKCLNNDLCKRTGEDGFSCETCDLLLT